MSDRAEKVKRLQEYYQRSDERFKRWQNAGFRHNATPPHEPMPDDLIDLRCEAKTRAGTPCKRKDIYRNGRCKYHGGASSGAKTAEGKARQLEGYRHWQEEQRKRTDEAAQGIAQNESRKLRKVALLHEA